MWYRPDKGIHLFLPDLIIDPNALKPLTILP